MKHIYKLIAAIFATMMTLAVVSCDTATEEEKTPEVLDTETIEKAPTEQTAPLADDLFDSVDSLPTKQIFTS